MSKYTTELRFICENYAGLSESQGCTKVNDIINKALPKIFDFDFPIFNEEYRKELEKKIVRHYYTREICCETVGRWKLFLEDKLNIIMPYYNQLYESALIEVKPLLTTDMNTNRTINRSSEDSLNANANSNDSKSSNTDVTNISDTTSNVTSSSIGNSSATNKESDTPQGGINGLVNDQYLTNASINSASDSVSSTTGTTDKVIQDNNSKSTESETREEKRTEGRTGKEVESYVESIQGFSGTNQSDLLLRFRETFLNIDNMVIEELNDLFFALW